jgi:hypothetical protein
LNFACRYTPGSKEGKALKAANLSLASIHFLQIFVTSDRGYLRVFKDDKGKPKPITKFWYDTRETLEKKVPYYWFLDNLQDAFDPFADVVSGQQYSGGGPDVFLIDRPIRPWDPDKKPTTDAFVLTFVAWYNDGTDPIEGWTDKKTKNITVCTNGLLWSFTQRFLGKKKPPITPGRIPTSIGMVSPFEINRGDGDVVTVQAFADDGSTPAGMASLSINPFGTFSQELDANGQATFTLDSLPAGRYDVQATYAGTLIYDTSQSVDQTLDVNSTSLIPVPTHTAFLSFPSSPINAHDSNQSCTAQVTADDQNSLQDKNVLLYINDANGNPYSDGSTTSPFQHTLDSNNQSRFTLGLPTGTYAVWAQFPAQGNYRESHTETRTLVVVPAPIPTTTTLTGPSSATNGVTASPFIARVTAADQSSLAGYTVELWIDGNTSPLEQKTLDSNGTATFATTADTWQPGTYQVLAHFPAQGNYKESWSDKITVVVSSPSGSGPVITAIVITMPHQMDECVGGSGPLDTTKVGSVKVTAQDGTSPKGIVNVYIAAWQPFDVFPPLFVPSPYFAPSVFFQLPSNGEQAPVMSAADITGGARWGGGGFITYYFVAVFSPDDQNTYVPSFDKSQTDLILPPPPGPGPEPTTTTTISCPSSIAHGDASARATVTIGASDGSVPTGPVQLTFSGFGTFTHYLQNGRTQYTLNSLPVGTYTLTANYPGYGTWPPSQSDPVNLIVGAGSGGPVTTTTTINAPPIVDGNNAVVTISVASSGGNANVVGQAASTSGGVPTGRVNLSVSGGQPIPMALNSQGVATYSLHPSGGPGDYTLDATYVPTGNFLASSAHGDLIVNPAGGPIATSIAISVPPTIQYQDHNARATVTVTAANGSTPSGTVGLAFSGFNGNQPFYHNLVNGSTQYTLDSLPPGMYTLTAAYAAQNGYAAGQATATLTVSTAASSLVNFVDFETGDFSRTASHVGGAIVTSPALDGHFSLQLLRNNSVANAEIRQSGTTYYNLPTAYYAFLFRLASQTGEGGVVNFQNTSSGYKAAIHLNATGNLVFYDANGTARGVGTTVLNPNQTYAISAKIGTGAYASWEVRINGNVELSGTGNLGGGNNGSIKLGGGSPYTTNYYYDDVAISANSYP